MRRNFIPINSNRLQPTSTQSSVLNHINKMSSMLPRPQQHGSPTTLPQPLKTNNININFNANVHDADSD